MERLYQTQEKDIEWQKSLNVRNVLLDGASAAAQGDGVEDDPKTAEGMRAYGRSVMDDSKGRLEGMLGVIAATKDVGLKTGQQLVKQTQQLKQAAADLGQVDSILDRTGVIARRMLRKAGTDKYLWCVILLVVVMVIAVCVYAAVHPGSGYNSPTELPH